MENLFFLIPDDWTAIQNIVPLHMQVITTDGVPNLSNSTAASVEDEKPKSYLIHNGITADQFIDPDDDTEPEVWVRKINQFGVVTIAFTEFMFSPNYKALAEQQFDQIDRRELAADSVELTDLQKFWILYQDYLLELRIKEVESYT